MSERGSFVTEYIYCEKCFEAAKRVLLAERGKFLCAQVIAGWSDGVELPIIAGKVGGLGPGDELVTFEYEIADKLQWQLCHPLKIAVLSECDDGKRFVQYLPRKVGE